MHIISLITLILQMYMYMIHCIANSDINKVLNHYFHNDTLVQSIANNKSVSDLHLSVANGFVSSKIYDKRDDFDFDIVNFPFLDDDVPRRASYGVYISQLIRFARVCNHVTDFNMITDFMLQRTE